jgi:predicted GIY-YIG superfamily endonuclease
MNARTKKSPPRRWRVSVVELHDELPRRCPELANLRVSLTVKDPRRIANHRDDLAPKRTFVDRESAEKARTSLMTRLKDRGFTVNGDLTVYFVYVIELDSAKAPNHRGYLYVGQTSLDREVRVEQHRAGHRDDAKSTHSRVAHRLFVRRRPEMEPRRVYFSREEAMRAESRLRRRLEARGYRVEGGTERLDVV